MQDSPSTNGGHRLIPERVEPPSPGGGNGRDGRGRFMKGNPGGPGNPFARRVAQLRAALLNVVTPEDIAGMAQHLLAMAKIGDLPAIKLLFLYAVGRPVDVEDPDTLDQREWQRRRQSAAHPDEIIRLTQRLPAEAACLMLRRTLAAARGRDGGAACRGAARG